MKLLATALFSVLLLTSLVVPVAADGSDGSNDTIAVLIDFGNGQVAWSDVPVTSGMNGMDATMQAAEDHGFAIDASASGMMNSIDGYTSDWPNATWNLWVWNSTTLGWDFGMVGAKSISASSVEAVAWSFAAYRDPVNYVNPYPPLATPEHRYPWASFRQDNLNSGYQPAYDPTNLTLKWQVDLGNGAIDAPMAVVGGFEYVVTSGALNTTTWGYDTDSFLYCLNSTGATVWRANIGHGGYQTAAPLVYGGMVIVASADGKVYAFDVKDGSTLWTYDTGTALTYGVASSPVVYNGNIIFAATNGVLYTLHDNGTEAIPNQTLASSIYSSSAAARDGVVYIGTESGDLVATTSNGAPLWSVALGSKVRGSPILLNDSIVVTYLNYTNPTDSAASSGGLACVSYDGQLLWQTELGITPASPVLTDGGIAVVNYTGMAKVDFNGHLLWYTDLGTAFSGAAPTSVNGTIFAVTNEANSRIVAVNSSSGEVYFQQNLSPAQYALSAPTVSDGMVFVAADNGNVYAYALNGAVPSPVSASNSDIPAWVWGVVLVAIFVILVVAFVVMRKK